MYLGDGPVGTPAADEQQASETVKVLVVGIGDLLLLWSILIKPVLPLLLIVTLCYLHTTRKKETLINNQSITKE